MGQQKSWVQTKYGSKNSRWKIQKYSCRKNFGLKCFEYLKIWGRKNIESKKLGEKNFWLENILVKKMLVQKTFWDLKTFGCKKILGAKKFWVQKNFGSKKIRVPKIWVRKPFVLVQKDC